MFELITSASYWVLTILWLVILGLYLGKLRHFKIAGGAIAVLLSILAIDAFRTVFESVYFGLYFNSLFGLLPISIYDMLTRPELVIIPKLINVAAGLLVLFLLIRRWVPREIREREEWIMALQKSEGHVRNLLDSAAEAIYGLDLQGKCTFCNPACIKMLGYEREEELLGQHMHDLIHHSHANGAPYPVEECQIYVAFQKGQGTHSDVEVLWRKDNTCFPAEYWSHPLRDNGKLIGSVVTFLDISERKEAEQKLERSHQALRNNERFLDSIINQIPNMVFIKEAKELRFVRLNKAGEELLGVSAEEMIGKNDYDFFPEEQAEFFIANDRKVLKNGKVLDIAQEPIETRDHGQRILHTRKVGIYDEAGAPQYLLGVSEDITEKREADQALIKAHKKADQANQAKSEFLANMSHELRTPLNSIIGFSEMMAYEIKGPLPKDYHEYSELIQASGKLLLETIGSILDIAKIEAGEFELTKETVSMDVIVDEAIALISIQAQEKGLQLVNKTGELPRLNVDHMRIKQVLLNVIGNAIKFTETGSVTIDNVSNEEGHNITISDTGIGMTDDQMKLAFEPFRQVHGTSLARKHQGTGLGLSLSRQVMLLHGGNLTAKSVLGKGSEITLHFPPEAEVDVAH